MDPLKQQIAQLEQQIAMLQQGGQPQQQPSMPGASLPAADMRQLYGLLAEHGDDPAQIGNQFAQSMQNNDRIAAYGAQARRMGSSENRARPVGSGFVDDQGRQSIPVWDPALKGGRGGFRTESVGQRFPETMKIGNLQYQRNPMVTDPTQPNYWMPAVDPAQAGQRAGTFDAASTVTGAAGTRQAAAAEALEYLKGTDNLLVNLINNENFDGAVGMLDQYTGKIGAQFGTEEGTLTKRAQTIANKLVTATVKDWKGAISNAELSFFQASVPQPGDGPAVWRDWYANVYRPALEFMELRAKGAIDETNSSLDGYIQGSAQRQAVSGYDPETQALIDKYGN